MPEGDAEDNRGRPARRRLVLAAVALAEALTIAHLVRTEVLGRHEAAEVQALAEGARRDRVHASARWELRLGGRPVGSVRSAVSGGQTDEQLAYHVEVRVEPPWDLDARGVVLADWDRRARRILLEAGMPAGRARVSGAQREDVFVIDAGFGSTPGVPPELVPVLVLESAPVLAPGPLPLPELGQLAPGWAREGTAEHPLTGLPVPWSVRVAGTERLTVAGREREALRVEATFGGAPTTAWLEPDGFPLRARLPLGIELELVEETR